MRFAYIRHIWECGRDSGGRGKAYRQIWSQRTEETEKKESNPGGYWRDRINGKKKEIFAG